MRDRETAQETAMSQPVRTMSTATWIQIAIVSVLLLMVFWATIRSTLVGRWLADGDWSHGFLIPVFSIYLLHSRIDELLRCRIRPSITGGVILTVCLASYFFFSWSIPIGYAQGMSLIGSIFGVTLLLGGWRLMRVAWVPIFFLVLAVPLPQSIYANLTLPLRLFASSVTGAVLPLLKSGLQVEVQGVVIDYAYTVMSDGGASERITGALNVEEACSGMHSLMAILALTVALAYIADRPTWQRVLIVLCSIPIAVFCNFFRITGTSLFNVYGYEEYATGTPHMLLGVLTFLIAFGLVGLVCYVLSHLYVEDPENSGDASVTL